MESTTGVRKLGVNSLEWVAEGSFRTSWQTVVGKYMYVIPLKFSDEHGMCRCPEKIGEYNIETSYFDTAFDFASFVSGTFGASISQYIVCMIYN